MYLTTVYLTFSAAHFLRHYQGKCENLHGHNWKVEITVKTEELDKAGMGSQGSRSASSTTSHMAPVGWTRS